MATICLRYTKNEQDAVEVLNTGFLKVYRNIERYDAAKASLYTWIRTIIVNCCLDHIRSGRTLSHAGELDQAADIHVPPEVVQRMKATELLELVRQLPPATQAVFNLYVMEGYSHAEIAAMVGISEGTSKWHLSEARKKLQQMINRSAVNE